MHGLPYRSGQVDEKYRLAVDDDDLKGVREDLIELGWGKVVA